MQPQPLALVRMKFANSLQIVKVKPTKPNWPSGIKVMRMFLDISGKRGFNITGVKYSNEPLPFGIMFSIEGTEYISEKITTY